MKLKSLAMMDEYQTFPYHNISILSYGK